MGQQPKWKTVRETDATLIQVDETGVYPPEMEVAQEVDSTGRVELFRFSLDQLKSVRGYLVPLRYAEDWPHPLPHYQEWFVKDLWSVAESHGTTEEELRQAFCSEDFKARAWAYECVGGHHGMVELDQYPLLLTAEEFAERWGH